MLTAQGNIQTHCVVMEQAEAAALDETVNTLSEERDLAITMTSEHQGVELWSKQTYNSIPTILFCHL